MIEAAQSLVTYIPFHQLSKEKSPFDVRTKRSDRIETLRNSLLKVGQQQPMIVEEVGNGAFNVLDGHCRVLAIEKIRSSGGSWEKILAQVLPASSAAPLEQFRVLRDRNLFGDNPFQVDEFGRFVRAFLELGLTKLSIADELHKTPLEIDYLIECADIHPALSDLLINTNLTPSHVVLLHNRFNRCLSSPYADKAIAIAKNVLNQNKEKPLSMKAWAFVLDFYWGKDTPFMVPRRASP